MREIADMRARALDDLAVGVDQRVGLACQRLDLDRERAGELLGLAGADRREPARNAIERREAEPHLEQGGEEEDGGQHQESGDDGAVEGEHLVVEFGGVAADRDQEAAVVAEIDVALDEPQPLFLGALHVALAAAVGIGRHRHSRRGAAGRDPTANATRSPRAWLWSTPRDLPIPARQWQLEQRLAEHLPGLLDRDLRRGEVGDQAS